MKAPSNRTRSPSLKIAEADVAQGQRAQAELHAQREFFRITLSSIGDAVIATDRHGLITSMNPVGEKLTGWNQDEALGRPLEAVFHIINGETGQRLVNPTAKVLASGTVVGLANDTVLVARDGTERPIADSAAPIRDEAQNLLGVVLVFHDISERKQAERQRDQLLAHEQAMRAEAEEANRLKDEFLATLSHELRPPLNAILGWVQLLRNGGTGAEEVDHGLEVIERNTRAQTQLINDLLDISQITSGKMRLNVEQVQLAPVMEAAVDSVRLAAEARGIDLQHELDPAVIVWGDADRLQQVVWNLLNNAIKFTPRGGRVSLSVQREGSTVRIVVSDTGAGIDPRFLPHLFERFRQMDSTTRRRHGGLGLGLALVRQLVEMHGGTVTAESAGAGQGAAFTVTLPLRAVAPKETSAKAGATAAGRAPDAQRRLEGVHVLVVDDEPDARDLISVALRKTGARVTAASSASEAMDLLKEQMPHVLLSDISMPEEDGFDLIRRVRALPPQRGGAVPALALTALARAEDRQRALEAGFHHHLAKPVDPAELVRTVVQLARQPEAGTEEH